MTERTQAAVVHYEPAELAVGLREMPLPEVGASDVLLEVRAASVCGSDVHQAYNRHSWPVSFPVILGHEFSGTVARKGKNVEQFKEGNRVVSETAAHVCGTCLMCRSGRYNLCPSRKGFGYGVAWRDDLVRQGARALPPPHSRRPAVRARLPQRAVCRGLSCDLRQRGDPAGRHGGGHRPRADRAACARMAALGGAESAGRGRPPGR